jgi:release factor glutamine methyltransferase
MTTWGQLLRTTDDALKRAGIPNHRREAEWIFEFASGLSRLQLLNQGTSEVDKTLECTVLELLHRRRQGEPLQYILGSVNFCGRLFQVGPGVLIPRPETEQLAEFALHLYPGRGKVCDMCTGSAVLAVTLALDLPNHPDVCAVDLSPQALQYARVNCAACHAANVDMVASNLFSGLTAQPIFSLVVANPPYVATRDMTELPTDIRLYEPAAALDGGPNGLHIFAQLAEQAFPRLCPNGWLLCEIGCQQGEKARDILHSCGYTETSVRPDLAGLDRFVCGRKPPSANPQPPHAGPQ